MTYIYAGESNFLTLGNATELPSSVFSTAHNGYNAILCVVGNYRFNLGLNGERYVREILKHSQAA